MARWQPAPSFSRSVAHLLRTMPDDVLNALLSKERMRGMLEALDVPLPRDYRVIGRMAQLTPADLAEPIVIKPVRSSSNRGVFALVAEGPDRWRDLLTGRTLDFAALRERMARVLIKDEAPDRWIVEELLLQDERGGGALDDIKMLTFHGRLGPTFVRTNQPRAFNWFDADWEHTSSGIWNHNIDRSIPPPAGKEEMVRIATRISEALPLPFVRVDMYATDRGPIVGELTVFPGWAHDLAPDFDELLGTMWEDAEMRLNPAAPFLEAMDVRLLPFFAPEPTRVPGFVA